MSYCVAAIASIAFLGVSAAIASDPVLPPRRPAPAPAPSSLQDHPGRWLAEGWQLASAEKGAATPSTRADTAQQDEAAFVKFVDYSGGLWTRPALTGDWGGLRTDLIRKGIKFSIDAVQTYQGVVEGGTDRHWKYGGSLDMVLDIDFQKAGLWPGAFLRLRAETQFGEFADTHTGALLPPNLDALFPLPDNHTTHLSSVMFMQFLSPWFGLILGKLDTLDGDGNHFAGARGKDQFLHPALVLNPAALRTTPYSALGVGCIILIPNAWGKDEAPGSLTFTLLDAGGVPNRSGFTDHPFHHVVSAFELRLPTKFAGLPGSQLLGATHSTRNFTGLDPNPRQLLAALLGIPGASLPRENDSWSFYYNFHQYLFIEPGQDTKGKGVNPDQNMLQGIGLFGRFGYADNKTSPVQAFYSIGVGGRGIIPGRDNDTFGVGYFYTSLSSELPRVVRRRFGDARGVEIYYNIEVTPWLHITPDIQIVDPSNKSVDKAVVFGVRAKIDF
jgi:porin